MQPKSHVRGGLWRYRAEKHAISWHMEMVKVNDPHFLLCGGVTDLFRWGASISHSPTVCHWQLQQNGVLHAASATAANSFLVRARAGLPSDRLALPGVVQIIAHLKSPPLAAFLETTLYPNNKCGIRARLAAFWREGEGRHEADLIKMISRALRSFHSIAEHWSWVLVPASSLPRAHNRHNLLLDENSMLASCRRTQLRAACGA